MGSLYLVATPIGNLEDITLRALKVLRSVGLIAAEDTRTTRGLLTHYDIHTPLTSNHNLNERSKIDDLLRQVQEKDIAIVSDAGTPLINDPGFPLVQAALEAGIKVIPIPGPSSPITALTVSGLPADQFVYLGYIPRKNTERRDFFEKVSSLEYSLICLETPHRIRESLRVIQEVLGDRQMAVCRELTKLYEEVLRCRVSEAINHFANTEPIGEFTLVIAGAPTFDSIWTESRLIDAIRQGISEQKKSTLMARELAQSSGWNRKQIYELIESMKKTS